MRHFGTRAVAALLMFLVGVGTVAVWLSLRDRPAGGVTARSVPAADEKPAPPAAAAPVAEQPPRPAPAEESAEDRAVRLAEEFIARNGYTHLPADRDRLSYESVEWANSVEELLSRRRSTLVPRAYGFRGEGRPGTEGGWTVVFRSRWHSADSPHESGRAVTMDKNFQNLRVEHQDFFLDKVDKTL